MIIEEANEKALARIVTKKVDLEHTAMSLTTANIQTNALNNIPRRLHKQQQQQQQQQQREGNRQQQQPRPIRSIIASDTSNSKIIYVYCSPKLKNAITCVLRLIVVAYCITVPLFVYLLYKESTDNIEKLANLEKQLTSHLKKRYREESGGDGNRVRRSYGSTNGNASLRIGKSNFLKNYKTSSPSRLKVNVDAEIKRLNKTVAAFGNRWALRKLVRNLRFFFKMSLAGIFSFPKINQIG